MDNKEHPKRKKDKYNPYSLQINEDKYVLSFVDGEGHKQSLEIDETLYQLFNSFELDDISHLNKVSRYIEHLEATDNLAWQRSSFISSEKFELCELMNIVDSLPRTQSRRIILYYIYGYTYREIAQIEKCSINAVAESINAGIISLREIL